MLLVSVDTLLVDTDIMAFKVGSVYADSVLKFVTRCSSHLYMTNSYDDSVTDIAPFKTTTMTTNTELSALIAWAETSLGLRYSVGEFFMCDP
jgi:hypothetical protein